MKLRELLERVVPERRRASHETEAKAADAVRESRMVTGQIRQWALEDHLYRPRPQKPK